MSGKRRSQSQLIRDRRRIADLYLQGWIQVDIAEKLGLGQATVSRDISALHKLWMESSLFDINEAKSQELAKIDRLEREYWDAWERSCENAETMVQRGVEADGKQRKEATKTVKGQTGDPRFLAGIQWCIERRCKILGIDATQKVDLRNTTQLILGGNIDPDDF